VVKARGARGPAVEFVVNDRDEGWLPEYGCSVTLVCAKHVTAKCPEILSTKILVDVLD